VFRLASRAVSELGPTLLINIIVVSFLGVATWCSALKAGRGQLTRRA
jgi:hypothetical protein